MFGKELDIYNTSVDQIVTYYLFVIVCFICILWKYRGSNFAIYVVLLFFPSLAIFFGSTANNVYKILVLLITLFWFHKTRCLNLVKNYKYVFTSFGLFSAAFFFSAYINGDYFSITFSQFSRFIEIFCLLHIFIRLRNNAHINVILGRLIYDILLIQILLSTIKFFVMGQKEGLVGTIAGQGGASATALPILGFIFLWLRKNGALHKRDWLVVTGLFLVGFAGAKRAIVFIMPIIVLVCSYYLPNKRITLKTIITSTLVFTLIFYLGIRLTPTLNSERSDWGNFDLGYTLEYAHNYMFSTDDSRYANEVRGRGSVTIYLLDKIVTAENINAEDWFGYGMRFIYATDYEEFANLGFDVLHKGSATGFFQGLVANGLIGILMFLAFVFSILFLTPNKRLRKVLFGIFIWEYFFYTGVLFRILPLSFLVLYFVVFSQKVFPQYTKGLRT